MSEPKNHHYIPQSYLRNFSEKRNDDHYVYVRYNGEKFHWNNIRNICSERDFYSIPGVAEDKKYFIEKYYAEHIDSLFPEIVGVITNDSILEIDQITRKKILTATLSLYFRTPKFLNVHNTHLRQTIELFKNYTLGKTEVHTIDFWGRKIDIRNIDLKQLEHEILQENKIVFLQQHFEVLNDFVDYRFNDGIGVKKIIDDSEFITSDNPVIIRNYKGDFTGLFDPENIIHLPINHKYLLTIFPKTESVLSNTFHRMEDRLRGVLVINCDVERESEKWIIGSENSVISHIEDQIKYNEPNEANKQWVENSEVELNLLETLNEVIERSNGEITVEFMEAMKKLSTHELLKDDPNLIRNIKKLREKGYEI